MFLFQLNAISGKKQSCGEVCGKARIGADRMVKWTEDDKIHGNPPQNKLFFIFQPDFLQPCSQQRERGDSFYVGHLSARWDIDREVNILFNEICSVLFHFLYRSKKMYQGAAANSILLDAVLPLPAS